AQVETARRSIDHRAVGVAASTAHGRVARLGADLEHAAEVARDALEPAAPDEPRELLPVEAQCLELFVVRAPEQRRAEAPIAGGNARIAFDGNPEHTRELAAHPRRFPLDVADLRERN